MPGNNSKYTPELWEETARYILESGRSAFQYGRGDWDRQEYGVQLGKGIPEKKRDVQLRRRKRNHPFEYE